MESTYPQFFEGLSLKVRILLLLLLEELERAPGHNDACIVNGEGVSHREEKSDD